MHIKVPSINVYYQHGQVGWGCSWIPLRLIYKMKSLSDISKAQTLTKKHTRTQAH